MYISNLSGCELVSLANSIALLVSKNLSEEDLSVLSAFFTSFADNLALLALKKI